MSEDPFALSGVLGRDYVRELCQPARYSARHLVFQITGMCKIPTGLSIFLCSSQSH